MSFKKRAKVEITKRPGPTGVMVESTSMEMKIAGDGTHYANEDVVFFESNVTVVLGIRGQVGQDYEAIVKINGESKTITGKLAKNGQNIIASEFPFSDFKLP